MLGYGSGHQVLANRLVFSVAGEADAFQVKLDVLNAGTNRTFADIDTHNVLVSFIVRFIRET